MRFFFCAGGLLLGGRGMAKNKKSFIAYVDWKDTFDVLPDDKAGQLVKYLFAYVNDENPESNDVLINAVFANIKHTLKRALRKYETIRAKRSEAGTASANKRQQVLTSVKSVQQTSTNSTDSVSVNVSDSVSVSEKKRRRKPFVAPSMDEVKQYFKENGYKEESAIKAFNYYSVANWFDSKGSPILNWKQKMINVWFKDENKIPKRMLA